MTEESVHLHEFVAMSAELTAFTEFDLYGTGLAETYLDEVVGIVGGDVVAELVHTYRRAVADASDPEQRESLLRTRVMSDPKLGPVARHVIKMWYVGNWYELPREWGETYGVRDADVDHVVSPVAYTEGLLWPAIGANPNGAKGPGYGTWADPPRIPPIPFPSGGGS